MGNTEAHRAWIFEHVLFLDQNASLDGSEEDLKKSSSKRKLDMYTRIMSKNRVTRHYPPEAFLQPCYYKIKIGIEGEYREFQIKCTNRPTAFILCDRNGQELRNIPISKVKKLQRRDREIDAFFSDGQSRQASLTMVFDDAKDCTSFCSTVKMLFGVFIYEYGHMDKVKVGENEKVFESEESDSTEEDSDDEYVQRARAKKDETRPEEARAGCPIHGSEECNCRISRPVLNPAEHESDNEEDITATHTNDLPVTIKGKLESGGTVQYGDVSVVGRRIPPKAIEWTVSKKVGGDKPEFGVREDFNGDSFQLTDSMVGHYIQVKVTRRFADASRRNAFVYSTGTAGPVTVSDRSAKGMLNLFLTDGHEQIVTMYHSDLVSFMGVAPNYVAADRPYFEGTLVVSRTSFKVEMLSSSRQGPLIRQVQFADVYASRPSPREEKDDSSEALAVYLHSIGDRGEQCDRIGLGSNEERDVFYHVFCYYKLSTDFKDFDRWTRDLASGNFAALKANYKRLWVKNSWTVYSSLANSVGQQRSYGLSEASESSEEEDSDSESTARMEGGRHNAPPAGGAPYNNDQRYAAPPSSAPRRQYTDSDSDSDNSSR